MPEKDRRLFFELSAKEQEELLRPVLEEALQKAAALNLPFVYQNELCTKPNQFIHKYPDGRTVLIEQDVNNSEETVVRVLQ